MHILHVTPYYVPAFAYGGVVRSVEGMARTLIARGHTVTVLTTDALTRDTVIQDDLDTIIDGVRVIRMRNLSLKLRADANLSTPLEMRRLAPGLIRAADVVHCHEFRTAENVIVTPIAQVIGKPLILSPHGTLTPSTGRSTFKSLWDRVVSPRMAQRFSGVIGLTEDEVIESRAMWQTFGARETTFTRIPNGVSLDEFSALDPSVGVGFRQTYGLGDAPLVLFLGRLHARKGIDLLIQAFKQLNHPTATLIIAGADEGMLAEIEPELTDRIRYLGFLDQAERRAALAAADVFALPAIGEGLPITALEALACGGVMYLGYRRAAEQAARAEEEAKLQQVEAAKQALAEEKARGASDKAVSQRFAEEFVKTLQESRGADAYKQTSPAYRAKIPEPRFAELIRPVVKAMADPSHRNPFVELVDRWGPTAGDRFEFKLVWTAGYEMTFTTAKAADGWRVDELTVRKE